MTVVIDDEFESEKVKSRVGNQGVLHIPINYNENKTKPRKDSKDVIDKNSESLVINMSFTTISKLSRGWNVLGECFHTHYKVKYPYHETMCLYC
jgi:hypothetical protein